MMSCRHCGTANENEAEKCRRCGRLLHTEEMTGKIPCVNHANRPAISTCNGCGNRLCDICAFEVDGLDFCKGCVPEGAVAAGFEEDYERLPVIESAAAERAAPGSRIAAAVIDSAVLSVVFGLIYLLLGLITGSWRAEIDPRQGAGLFGAYCLMSLLAGIAYHSVQLTMTGQTIGKRLCGVIVLTDDLTLLSFKQALTRTLWALLSLVPFGLGGFWAFLHIDGNAWHDGLSKTYAYRYDDAL